MKKIKKEDRKKKGKKEKRTTDKNKDRHVEIKLVGRTDRQTDVKKKENAKKWHILDCSTSILHL